MTENKRKASFGVVTKEGRFIGDKILSQYATKANEESKQLPPDSFVNMYGELGLVQPLYNPEALANILEVNTYHYRCCKTKARDTAGLGWTIKPLNDKVSKESEMFKKVDDFFANQDETVSQIFDKMMLDYEAVGYGAIELVREDYTVDGEPVLIAHVPAYTIRVNKDGNRFCQSRNGKKRWFKMAGLEQDIDAETGVLYPMGTLDTSKRGSEIIWFINYTPRSDYYGLSDIIPALGAVWGDVARRNYNISFFDNYGVPAYAVFITGNFDPGEVDESGRSDLEKEIETHFEELAKNPQSVLLMTVPTQGRDEEVKIEFQKLSVETKEASFRMYRVDNRDEILSCHGVPPYRVGINETGSLGGSTAKESTEIYKTSVLKPRQEMIESTINRLIIWSGFDAQDFEFCLTEIDNSDNELNIKISSELFRNGAMTPNQLIRLFGEQFGLEESEHPAMSAHYINGMPIDYEMPVDSAAMENTEMVMLSLQNRLLNMVQKNEARTGNSQRD